MNHMEKDYEYFSIVGDILEHEEFKKLENIKHHDSNRMDHCLKVSYYSYMIAKSLHLNYAEVARGGLLHDFFMECTTDYDAVKDKVIFYTNGHPKDAIENSKKYFGLSKMEEDMIRSHMFPFDIHVPKYAESWIVNLVDTVLSTKELTKKFGYKLSYLTNLYLIVMLNGLK